MKREACTSDWVTRPAARGHVDTDGPRFVTGKRFSRASARASAIITRFTVVLPHGVLWEQA
jgi:hypothetical protein